MPRAYRIRPAELGGSSIDYTDLPPAASGVAPGPAYPSQSPVPPSGDVYGAPRAPYVPPAATPAPSYPNLSNSPTVNADYFPSSVGYPDLRDASTVTADYLGPRNYPDLSNESIVTAQPSTPDIAALLNQPLPAVQQLLFGNNQRNQAAMAPDWASNARGTFGRGPNYVDPRAANAFIAGLVNWNAGGWSANPTGGEPGAAILGRGPTTRQGLARAGALRGGGPGAVPGMAARIT